MLCIPLVLKVTAFMGGCRYSIVSDDSCCVWGYCCLWFFCGMLGVNPLGSVPVFVVFLCSLLVFGCVHRWVSVGHDARGWEGHVDARWRLRHRAVFIVGLGLCDCFQLVLVLVLWVVGIMYLSFSNVGCFLYPLWSQFVWFRSYMCNFHWVGFA